MKHSSLFVAGIAKKVCKIIVKFGVVGYSAETRSAGEEGNISYLIPDEMHRKIGRCLH